MTDHGWIEASVRYQDALRGASDRVERLRLLSNLPTFSVWRDVREELAEAAREIESLRARVRALEGEDA